MGRIFVDRILAQPHAEACEESALALSLARTRPTPTINPASGSGRLSPDAAAARQAFLAMVTI